MPLRSEYDASGHAVSLRRGIILSVMDGDLTGWGEFVELPGYSRETTDTAIAALRKDPLIHSNPMALAARRSAELDLQAKQAATPLTSLLGAGPGPVEAGAVVARVGDVDGLIAEAQNRVAEGYRKLKIKVEPGFDIVPVRALRESFPAVAVAADANGSYSSGEVPRELDDFGLLYLEQPYPARTDWRELAALRGSMETPIGLDEAITGPPTLRSAIATSACDLVTLKPARYAGLEQAIELHDLAQESGLGLVAGGLLETGIGRAAALAFARLPGFTMPADLSASDRYWERDLVEPPWTLDDGRLIVTDQPGIGVEVDRSFLSDVTVATYALQT